MSNLLEIKNLHASVGDNEILKGIDLTIKKGETHVIMGPNGAGKSTLGCTILGDETYEVSEGTITFKGEDITDEDTSSRAKKGLFLTFQNPVEIPGISLSNFIKTSMDTIKGEKTRFGVFKKQLKEKLDLLNMDSSYVERDLNVGFSGGEKKKSEILQMLMINPDLAILDETDSGLDIDAVKTVSDGVKAFQDSGDGSLIIITHNTRILDSLNVDYTHVVVDGKIVDNGGPELIDEIIANGFEKYTA